MDVFAIRGSIDFSSTSRDTIGRLLGTAGLELLLLLCVFASCTRFLFSCFLSQQLFGYSCSLQVLFFLRVNVTMIQKQCSSLRTFTPVPLAAAASKFLLELPSPPLMKGRHCRLVTQGSQSFRSKSRTVIGCSTAAEQAPTCALSCCCCIHSAALASKRSLMKGITRASWMGVSILSQAVLDSWLIRIFSPMVPTSMEYWALSSTRASWLKRELSSSVACSLCQTSCKVTRRFAAGCDRQAGRQAEIPGKVPGLR